MKLKNHSNFKPASTQLRKGIYSTTPLHLTPKKQEPIEEPTMTHEEMCRYHFDHVMRNNNSTTPMGTQYMRRLVFLALTGHIDNPEPVLKLIKAYIRTEDQQDVARAAQDEIKRLLKVETNIALKNAAKNNRKEFLQDEEKDNESKAIDTSFKLATRTYIKLNETSRDEIFKTPPRGKGMPINKIIGSPQSVAFTEKELKPKSVRFKLPKKVNFEYLKNNKKPYFLLPSDLIE